MSAAISITADDVFAELRAFILGLLPDDPVPEVIQGIGNRVAMPAAPFVAMTSLMMTRLSTNIDHYGIDPITASEQNTENNISINIQIDCYGPQSQDWTNILTTMLRSDYAVRELGPNVWPLYAADPQQIPLVDGEQQYEQRWMITAVLQYNPIVTIPMQFADTLDIELVNVDAVYPPT